MTPMLMQVYTMKGARPSSSSSVSGPSGRSPPSLPFPLITTRQATHRQGAEVHDIELTLDSADDCQPYPQEITGVEDLSKE